MSLSYSRLFLQKLGGGCGIVKTVTCFLKFIQPSCHRNGGWAWWPLWLDDISLLQVCVAMWLFCKRMRAEMMDSTSRSETWDIRHGNDPDFNYEDGNSAQVHGRQSLRRNLGSSLNKEYGCSADLDCLHVVCYVSERYIPLLSCFVLGSFFYNTLVLPWLIQVLWEEENLCIKQGTSYSCG